MNNLHVPEGPIGLIRGASSFAFSTKLHDIILRRLIALLSTRFSVPQGTEEETLSMLAELREKIDTASGVYQLGSANPVVGVRGWEKLEEEADKALLEWQDKKGEQPKHSYESFGGIDTQPFSVTSDGFAHRLHLVQGVSISHQQWSSGTKVRGNIIALSDDGSLFTRGEEVPCIVLQVMNQYGHAHWLGLQDLEITRHDVGVSLDDIFVEDIYEFVALQFYPWTKGQIIRAFPHKDNPHKTAYRHLVDSKGVEIEKLEQAQKVG
jgi:hypothetical protein